MKRIWLIIDVSNLCWRAFHTTRGLSHAGKSTGVTFGFFKAVQNLMDLHATRSVAFCFDHGASIRKTMDARYKFDRHNRKLTEQELIDYTDVKRQVKLIKKDYLPRLGFKNIFYQTGYEADDCIASAVKTLPIGDEALIVSTDKDMLQLLTKRVHIWQPVKQVCITQQSFIKEWGLMPKHHATIKAIAGCKSDGVKGIKGIGEKTATKYLLDELNKDQKYYQLIIKGREIWRENLSLVQLPLWGCKQFTLQEDEVKPRAWKILTNKLGMRSISGRVPGMVTGFGIIPKKVGSYV